MRQSILFASVSALALSVVAAGSGRAQTTDWQKQLGQHPGLTLKIISETDPYIEAMKQTIVGFTPITGAKIDVDGYGYDALHDKELLGCSQNDSTYDVMMIDGIWIGEFVQAGCIDPIDKRIAADPKTVAWDDFTPGGAAQASWEGQRYCVPVAIYYELMYYRTDLFGKAGLQPPKTFDDLKNDAKTFTNNPDFPGVYGFAMNNQRGAAAGQQYFEWIINAGGKAWTSNYPGSKQPYSDMTPLLNSPASVKLVQFFRDMVPYGPPGVTGYAWDERANAFASGKLAMINDWSVRAQIANDPKQSQIAGKFKSILMPTELAQTNSPVGGWIMCMNAHGSHKDAAWDLMKWFASPEIHKQYVLAGGTPSRISALTDSEIRQKFPWTATIYEAQKDAWSEVRPRIPETFQLINTVGIDVNKAIIGDMTVKTAMDNANAKVTDLLRSNGEMK